MVDVFKILVLLQRNARGPRQNKYNSMNQVFTNHSEENEIYPLTVKEIVEAQIANSELKHFFKSNAVLDKGLEIQLIENKSCICHKGWLVIPKPLQGCAVMWYHHYLQHPGHTHLKEAMTAAIYWKGKTCQVNKKRAQKYGHLPPKIVISTPWEALIRSAKQDDNYGASNIVLPCPGS
jgi:hypothetical protein